jgi:putative spermidine/putrescine transport system ATP-binding protein
MDAPLLRFEGVSKTNPARKGQPAPAALAALDLDVARGELLTLLGPSGSGKTTTLMLLAGFETPDTGRILLEGRDIARLPAHKRNVVVAMDGDIATLELPNGTVIAARASESLAPGTRCTIMVRPERIVLGPDGLAAHVAEALFQGDHIRLRLSLGGIEIVAKRPAGAAAPQPGNEIRVRWRAEDARAFRDDAARA